MLNMAKILVSLAIVMELMFFCILRNLWHAVSKADTKGIDKYLKLYFILYILTWGVSFYAKAKKAAVAPKKEKSNLWWIISVVELLFNLWFIYYTHGVHTLVANIKRHE